MSQPDFREIFFQNFKNATQGIRYKVRSDSNLQHDVHFLYSLVKDARFRPGDIRHLKNTLVIPLIRARWELREEVNKQNLLDIPSELKFGRVKKIQWIAKDVSLTPPYEGSLFDSGDLISSDTVCEIDSFFIGESTHNGKSGGVEVVLAGYPGYWQLRISLTLESWSISVKDSKPPDSSGASSAK